LNQTLLWKVDEEEEIMEAFYEDLLIFVTQRYLELSSPVAKSTAWFSNVLPELDDKRFKIMMRMTKDQFSTVLKLIENNPVFLTDKKQLPVATQLSIVLFRLGSYGSGIAIAKLSTLFGIGDGGTVERVTERVFEVSHRNFLALNHMIEIYWLIHTRQSCVSRAVTFVGQQQKKGKILYKKMVRTYPTVLAF